MSERSPMRLSERERKSGAPPTTNSFSSSAEETSGAAPSRGAEAKHKRLQIKEEGIIKEKRNFW